MLIPQIKQESKQSAWILEFLTMELWLVSFNWYWVLVKSSLKFKHYKQIREINLGEPDMWQTSFWNRTPLDLGFRLPSASYIMNKLYKNLQKWWLLWPQKKLFILSYVKDKSHFSKSIFIVTYWRNNICIRIFLLRASVHVFEYFHFYDLISRHKNRVYWT